MTALHYVCCELGCGRVGEFAVYAITGELDDDSTVACTQHVGILLGSLTARPWGSYHWQVHALNAEVSHDAA